MIAAATDPTIASALTGVFADAFTMIGPFAGPLGSLLALTGAFILVKGLFDVRRGMMMGAAQQVGTGVVMAGLGIALPFFAGNESGDGSKTVAERPAPVDEPAPSATDTGTWSSFDVSAAEVMTVLGVTLTALIVLAVAAVIVMALRSQNRTRTERRAAAEQARVEEESRLDRVWTEAVARHDHVRDEMMRHQSDIDLVLSMPVINDQQDAKTAAFTEALARAADLAHDTRPASAEAVDAYAAATRAAERAWGAAWRNADRVRLSQFSPEERATIQQVIKLMKRAEFETTPEARNLYYRKALKDLGHLIEIPRPASEAIEQRIVGVLANPAAASAAEPILTPTAARLLAGRAREAMARVGAR